MRRRYDLYSTFPFASDGIATRRNRSGLLRLLAPCQTQNATYSTGRPIADSRMTICVRCLVSGRVQGVYYRGTTQTKAVALDVTGYARNLPDGRVEVLACGDKNQVEQLTAWLWDGPRLADVAQVDCQQLELDVLPSTFITT